MKAHANIIFVALSLLYLAGCLFSTAVTNCQSITNPSGSPYLLSNNLNGSPVQLPELSTFYDFACIKIAASNVVFDCNGYNITENGSHTYPTYTTHGIFVNGSYNNVTIKNCPGISNYYYGINLYYANNNTIFNNTAFNNTFNFIVSSGNYNNISNNIAYKSTYANFEVTDASLIYQPHDNILANNVAYNSSNDYGFYVHTGVNNSLINNSAFNNTAGGFDFASGFGTLMNNVAYKNGRGFYINSYPNNTIINNTAHDNTVDGMDIEQATNNTIINNTLYNNARWGIEFAGGVNYTTITNLLLYNNSVDDWYVYSADVNHYNATNITFEGPGDGNLNSTSLNIYDDSPVASYNISWNAGPGSTPADRISFAQKFLRIQGSGTISSISFTWQPSDLNSTYNENLFELWKYTSGSWGISPLNDTPDIANHVLSLYNIIPSSTYAIMQNNVTNCPIVNTSFTMANNYTGAPNDASGLPTGSNVCVKITASNLVFDCNGYSITNNGTSAAIGIALKGSLTNVTVKDCPMVSGYSYGLYTYNSNSSTFRNLTISNSSYDGIGIDSSANNVFANITIFNSSNDGIDVYGDSNNFTNNIVYGSKYYGIFVNSNLNRFAGNSLFQNGVDSGYSQLTLNSGSNNTLLSNTVFNNTNGAGIFVYTKFNNVVNNTLYNDQYGMVFAYGANNSVYNNTACNNTVDGFYVSSPEANDTFVNNTGCSNLGNGFEFVGILSDENFSNNIAWNNTNDGFHLYLTSGNSTFFNDTAFSNHQEGFYANTVSNHTFISDIAYNNTDSGFYLIYSTNLAFADAKSSSNARGIAIMDLVNATSFANTTLFNNSNYDLYLESAVSIRYNMTNTTFLNPSGTMTNHTTLDISDQLGSSQRYYLKWSAEPAVPPFSSFAGKYVRMASLSGSPTIDTIVWRWDASEVTTQYNESGFDIYRYSSGWTDMHAALNLTLHTLGLSNVIPSGVFGILNTTQQTIVVTPISPSNNAMGNNSVVTFNFSAQGPAIAYNCSIYLDSSLNKTNTSVINATTTSFVIIGIPEGQHNWAISCNDTYGDTNTGAVSNFTVDLHAPVVSSFFPPNDVILGVNSSNFTFSAIDSFSPNFSCSLLSGASGNTPVPGRTNTSVLNDTYTNFTVQNIPNGKYMWRVNCTDLAGNMGIGPLRNITIDTIPPAILLNAPGNNTAFNLSAMDFNFTATDNLASAMNCSIFLDGILNQTNNNTLNGSLTNFNIPSIPDGQHNWSISCNDSINANSSGNRSFLVDTAPPIVKLYSPGNNALFNASTVDFNFTASDDIAPTLACSLYIDSILNQTNLSMVSGSTFDFLVNGIPEGVHNWQVRCNDSMNTGISPTRNFTVDLHPPNVTSIFPPDGAVLGVNYTNFTFVATDNFSPNFSCTLLGGVLGNLPVRTNTSVFNNTVTNFSFSGAPDGKYMWRVNCTDLGGNMGLGPLRNITIDTTPPTISLLSPLNDDNLTSSSASFSFIPADNIAPTLSCSLFVNGSLVSTNPSAGNGTTSSISATSLTNGPHNWFINCSDGVNTGVSATWNFTVNISSTKPPSNPPSEHRPLSVSLSSTCDGDIATVTYNGRPVEGIHVLVDGSNGQNVYYTDTDGKIGFSGCDGTVAITASGSGYDPKTLSGASLIACSSCQTIKPPVCGANEILQSYACVCASGYESVSGNCLAECKSGETRINGVCTPQCVAPGCCKTDSACEDAYYCTNRDTGAATGSCQQVTGCGLVSNHRITETYACGDQAACPQCPQGSDCVEHTCVSRDIQGNGGFIGTSADISTTENGLRCSYCKVVVTSPNGAVSDMTTDQGGNLLIPLAIQGVYKATLLGRNGEPVKTIQLQALPKAVVPPLTPPSTILDQVAPYLLWLLILLLIILAIILYWRRRKEKKQK